MRDENLLESALETLFQSFGVGELYPGVQEKAGSKKCNDLLQWIIEHEK